MATVKGFHAKLIAERYKEVLEDKDYAFFESGKYNVNIIGVRSDNRRANKFDDMVLVIYKNSSKDWEVFTAPITTDPGWTYLKDASAKYGGRGTAILVPNQYRSTYKIDTHISYTALCQRSGDVSVYRDSTKDMNLDFDKDTVVTGKFGINIHRAKKYGETENVGPHSAGCQVFKNSTDFSSFMKLINKSADTWGNSFTYTLISEGDLN
jgi:hypothetical protein